MSCRWRWEYRLCFPVSQKDEGIPYRVVPLISLGGSSACLKHHQCCGSGSVGMRVTSLVKKVLHVYVCKKIVNNDASEIKKFKINIYIRIWLWVDPGGPADAVYETVRRSGSVSNEKSDPDPNKNGLDPQHWQYWSVVGSPGSCTTSWTRCPLL